MMTALSMALRKNLPFQVVSEFIGDISMHAQKQSFLATNCDNLARGKDQFEANTVLLIVHPGDVIEHPFGWSSQALSNAVVQASLSNQAAIAKQIVQRLPDALTVVLHRESSAQILESLGSKHRKKPAPCPWIDKEYVNAIDEASRQGVMLYGDDLDQAAKWILQSGWIADDANIFMTGAYSDATFGCITHLGKCLLKGKPDLTITVDPASPTDASNSVSRWVPALAIEKARLGPAP